MIRKEISLFLKQMKENRSILLPFATIIFVVLMLGALHWGWFNTFFFGAEHAQVQGIDYFAVPKSYLNLLERRSIYDTWGGAAYGPHSTWYLAHPAFSVFVASWFSFFSPWTSYWLFVLFSLLIMAYCGYLIAAATTNIVHKRLSYFILLCAFPTFWLLYVGNMHAPLVLALTLILLAIYGFTYGENDKQARNKLMAGLLISFFSKPIVLLMLPLFLLMKETRKTTIKAILIYAVVSFIFIVDPLLNPQGIGLTKLGNLLLDFDFIKEHMNIYKNQFVLNEYMKDNSIHWLNLIAQSDYKLMHIDVFSLPVFIETILGKELSSAIYKLPIYLGFLLSFGVALIGDKKRRLETALLLVMALSLTFFLSYNTVWEYQFTSALPVVALLPVLKSKDVFYKKYISMMFIAGLLFCLPTFYFMVHNGDYQSSTALTLIRFNRVVPALFLFVVMASLVIAGIKRYGDIRELKKISLRPEKFFFE